MRVCPKGWYPSFTVIFPIEMALLGVYRIGLGKPTLAKENLYWTKQALREPDRSVIIYVEMASPSKAFEKKLVLIAIMEVSPDSDCRLVDATTQCWEHREQSGFLSLFDASIRISSHHFAGSSSRFCTVS
jgi:hypothetical protein